ncbi:SDR family NAD(P)-dependent oxidoreductase [Gorillibacterium timonense]|uniref:SDR family NAD(P)-dependent oxidoreductase n=1 Tax=Gorillibacterium timonense TaxID=1689269 RepID=UPI00071D0741|nr:SDR family NAD(P)-dependent oxidoreductase [Gorillibacterium timonense]
MEEHKLATNKQHKLGSGFGYRSTAEEVLSGIDLSGKLALVTGGYSGLGLETTRALVRAGARVIVPARRPALAEEALAGLSGVEVEELDLSDLASVQALASRILARGLSIDIAILNAAIMACPETRVGPGWESQFATNYIGHYVLIQLLWPAFISGGGARVVAVSSIGHHRSPILWDDIQLTEGYEKFKAYGQSKTAVSLFTVELDRRGEKHGVRSFSVHPGGIMTPLQRYLPKEEMIARGWFDETGEVVNPAFKTPEQGASTQVWAATSPQLTGIGGVYCEDCDIAEMAVDGNSLSGVKPYAIDPEQAARLWRLTAELTGVDRIPSA